MQEVLLTLALKCMMQFRVQFHLRQISKDSQIIYETQTPRVTGTECFQQKLFSLKSARQAIPGCPKTK